MSAVGSTARKSWTTRATEPPSLWHGTRPAPLPAGQLMSARLYPPTSSRLVTRGCRRSTPECACRARRCSLRQILRPVGGHAELGEWSFDVAPKRTRSALGGSLTGCGDGAFADPSPHEPEPERATKE